MLSRGVEASESQHYFVFSLGDLRGGDNNPPETTLRPVYIVHQSARGISLANPIFYTPIFLGSSMSALRDISRALRLSQCYLITLSRLCSTALAERNPEILTQYQQERSLTRVLPDVGEIFAGSSGSRALHSLHLD